MFVLIDIGCIECGMSSDVVGVYDTKEQAIEVMKKCKENKWEWTGGQHKFDIVEIKEKNVTKPHYLLMNSKD